MRDNHEFVDCTFRGCELSYHGGRLSFVGGTHFVRSNITLRGAAARTHEIMLYLHTGLSRKLTDGGRIRINEAWV